MSQKAKDLDSLIRLHTWTVDERQRELGVIQSREEQLVQADKQLDQQLLNEQAVAARDPTTAGFLYGAYGRDHLRRKAELAHQLVLIRQEIEEARERLAEAFRQLKVYEEVRKGRAKREAVEAARKEQEALDEIGLNLHRRKNPA